VVVVGSRGEIAIDPRGLMGRDSSVRGMALFNVGRDEFLECAAGIGGGLEAGWLRPVVQEVIPLAEAPRAHEALMGEGKRGNVVLRVS
jgi:NADPH2:quinone reductase